MVKMKKSGLGLLIPKTLRIGGVTFYQRGGQVIGRVSESREKRSNTLRQFIQRQKMRHTTALWKMLKYSEPMFTERANAWQDFASLANGLPPVYVEKKQMTDASFLMPGIPVSNGTLPAIEQQLGEVDGTPALLTDLKASNLPQTIRSQRQDADVIVIKSESLHGEHLWLYTAEQKIEGPLPRVRFSRREVSRQEMAVVDGRLALVSEEFSDPMKGWALVRVSGDRCSPQVIVTRCTLYQQYMTDEALQRAAKSYGGITESPFL